MDWLDLISKLAPAATALIGAYVGAHLVRRTALDAARLTVEGQHSLAREAAARTEQTAERERRRELLEPLLACAREHARDVENYITGFTKESPARLPILREDYAGVPLRPRVSRRPCASGKWSRLG
jgi:hypothetical protein